MATVNRDGGRLVKPRPSVALSPQPLAAAFCSARRETTRAGGHHQRYNFEPMNYPAHRFVSAIAVATLLLAGRLAAAADYPIQNDVPPRSWLKAVLPENLPALQYPEYVKDRPVERSRIEAFAGRYRLSLMTLSLADAKTNPKQIAVVKATDLIALGRNDEAIAALSDPWFAGDGKVQLLHANALMNLGRTEEALALLKQHLTTFPDSLGGHYALGQLYEQIGDIDSARTAYAWFVKGPGKLFDRWESQQEKGFDNAEDVVTIGRAVDRWAAMSMAYQITPQLNDSLLNLFVKAYDVIDRDYWPANVAAAEYWQAHDNAHAAEEELQAAFGGNPNDLRALKLKAKIALANFNFDQCDQVIERMRDLDPNSIDADLLETRNLLAQRTPENAIHPVQRVLDKQPKNLEALGLLAAVYALELHDDQTADVLKQIDAIAPQDATSYEEVAQQLGAMRQYPRSEAMYKTALQRAPWWTAARNGLGLLYTQSGDEGSARSTLEAAHALDPYNLQTTNYLRLLDDLDKFARSETAHFIVFYDAAQDPIIPEYFGDYLETAYKAVTSDFKTEPLVKTYIEVFPTHDAFSVRTTGSPWIGTVGASTGRVIALVSPRKGEMTMGTFNWSQVLRHEFTHTVTLAATDNRIPHWFTEGLAVWEEHSPLRWDWIPMLYQAVNNDGLFSLDDLTWAFIRPRRPIDRQLAYAQSFWICTYIEQTYGHDAILKMLAAFKDGLSQDDVFPKVLGRGTFAFSQEFHDWTLKQVATWGYDPQTSKKYADLRERGETLIKSHQYKEAVDVWEQIVAIRPVDALPHQRLAGLYLTTQMRNVDKAIENLSALDAVELKDDRFAKRISRLERDEGELPRAIAEAQRAVYTDPYDMDAHQLLAELFEKAGDQTGLAHEQRVIPVLQKWIDDNQHRDDIPAGGH
jgi:tetratricopeptide (TPR) repeat protein